MAIGRSNYPGLAAAAVFLAGLFIVGNASVRIAVSGVAGFAIALAISSTASRRVLVCAIAAAICSALVAYNALSCEKTGKATYHHWGGRRGWDEPVTREGSPSKFREATNHTWAFSLLLLTVGAGCFMYSRQLDAADDFP